MPNTNNTLPSSGTNDSTVGTTDWSTISAIWSSNTNDKAESHSIEQPGSGEYFKDYSVKLVKGGTITGDNKASSTKYPRLSANITRGNSTDMWGVTLTPSDVNSSNFGVVISSRGYDSGDNTKGAITKYIKLTGFGFSIPTGASILGIEFTTSIRTYGGYDGLAVAWIYNAYLKVYYSDVGSPNLATITLTSTPTTATFINSASVSPVAVTWSTSNPITTYIQEETASVSSESVVFSTPSVTSTYEYQYNATPISVGVNFGISTLTTTHESVWSKNVSPIKSIFRFPQVTTNNYGVWDNIIRENTSWNNSGSQNTSYNNYIKNETTHLTRDNNTTGWMDKSKTSTSWKEL